MLSIKSKYYQILISILLGALFIFSGSLEAQQTQSSTTLNNTGNSGGQEITSNPLSNSGNSGTQKTKSNTLGTSGGLGGQDSKPNDLGDTASSEPANHCKAPGVLVPGKLVCNADDPTYLYTSDACGNPLGRSTKRCYSKKVCEEHSSTGQAFCSCPATGKLVCAASNANYANSLVDDTYVVKGRHCSNGPLDSSDIVETCGFGTVCLVDDYTKFGHKQRNGGQAFCARSMTNSESPYYNFGSDRVTPEFMRYPTALEVDCRGRVSGVSGSFEFGGQGGQPVDPNNADPSLNPHANPTGPIVNCAAPTTVDRIKWPVAYGEGPVFSEFNDGASTWYGAEFDPEKRELYSLVKWTNPEYSETASIVAWNVDTKDRRIVTGWFPDDINGLEEFGSGYNSPASFEFVTEKAPVPLKLADVIRLADDGNLYVSSRDEIIRVNPETGERTLVWRRQVEGVTGGISFQYGQCLRPDHLGGRTGLDLELVSFEVGPNLEFYKAFRDERGGNGIIKISADAKTCTVISRWGDKGSRDTTGKGNSVAPKPKIGKGPALQRFPVQGMLYHNDALWAVSNKKLIRFDLKTGNYRRMDDSKHGLSIGYTSMSWDPSRKVLWLSGSVDALYGNVVVNPINGQKELIITDTGLKQYPGREILRSVYPGGGSGANTGGGATSNSNRTQLGGVILDPKNSDITYGVTNTGALLKFELSTFNNYIHSWGQH